MKRGALVLVTLALAALAAGCADPPAAIPSEPAPPEPAFADLPIDAMVPVYPQPGCNAATCTGAGLPTLLLSANTSIAIRSVLLQVGEPDGQAASTIGSIRWELTCQVSDSDDERCARVLGRGEGEAPLTIDLPSLDVPPGAQLWLHLSVPPKIEPVVDLVLWPTNGRSQVTGSVGAALVSDALRPSVVTESIPVAWDGHTGPCALLVEQDCPGWPGGSSFEARADDGVFVATRLVMTWTSTSPADEVLEIHVGGLCPPDCAQMQAVSGVSPLQVDVTGLDVEGEFEFRIYPGDPTGYDQLGLTSYASLHTPVHVEGEIIVEYRDTAPTQE